MQQQQEGRREKERQGPNRPSSLAACEICGEGEDHTEKQPQEERETLFALRCNCCRRWYHPWCMGYQLDLDRSCMITASELDIPIDAATGVPLVCQWFCDSCASTETGAVAATGRRPRTSNIEEPKRRGCAASGQQPKGKSRK